jgi:ribulose-phosphate 3-epimerase
MTSLIKISPSILSCNFSKLGEEIESLEKAGADLIHIDVMDGHFVPNITIGPEVIKKIRPLTKVPFDVHLMISPVDNFIEDFANAGSDTKNLKKSIELIKKFDKKVGISLNPNSEVSLVEPYLNDIDLILVMSVNPGFAGQKFKPEVLKKLEKIKKIIVSKNLKIDLEIDGGISFQNSIDAKNAGANILVSGSTIFNENNGDLKKNIDLLRTN